MNFADEPYFRLYTRDTKTWLKLGFEGQTMLMHLGRKLDRAGILDGIDDLVEDVALVTGVPIAFVAIGLPRLLELGVFVHRGDCLVMPNYVEAQSCAKSDRLRQQELRERRRLDALAEPVTKRDEPSRDVTAVTSRHEPSQVVTPICALPILPVPSESGARAPASAHVASSAPPSPTPVNDVEPTPPESSAAERAPSRTYSVPQGPPPKDYLDEAVMRAIPLEQARSTWEWYQGAGLPERGVERLHDWLLHQAKERLTKLARLPLARASPNPRASKQSNAGLTGFESLSRSKESP